MQTNTTTPHISLELGDITPAGWRGAKLIPSIGLMLFAGVFWAMTPPEGLTPQAWHLLIIFLTTITAVILKPLPMVSVLMVSIAFCLTTQTLSLEQVLSSFNSHVVWLIVLAFFLAIGFKSTGLGKRISYYFIAKMGHSSLGLSYGFVLTELVLAPFVPSNTARGAGIVFPIVNALVKEQGSDPKDGTQRKIGAYLMSICFHANVITSAMFLTALVGNPLIVSFASNSGVEISWMTWALAAFVPGMVSLAILPYALYKIYPPEVKFSPQAPQNAAAKLKEMGKLSLNEMLMLATFFGILLLWIFGDKIGINPTTAALIGFAILLFCGVIRWNECVQEKGAWEVLMWFAPLLMMTTFLTKFGVMTWFSGKIQGVVGGLSWPLAFLCIALVYYYINYLFASITSRITALYSVFLMVLLASNTPPMIAAMGLAVLSSLSGGLTHFGTGTAPVFFGANYVPVTDWWRNGFILSAINLIVWGVIGGVWWKVLGYW